MIKIEELVERSKNKDKEAYSQLIQYIYTDLYKIAKRKLSNEEDVQDAVQATVINAYINIHKLKNNKYFKTWITKILINECNQFYRQQKRNHELLEKCSNILRNEKNSNVSVEFEKIIATLSDHEKEIFKLYYKNGFSIKEIAKIFNLKPSTIKATLSKGRKKLRSKLKPITMIIILCIFISTSVVSATFIHYIKNLFDTNCIGKNNDGILSAIEDSNWYQEIDMDYADLGNGYKLKIDYLLVDEMNLYFITNFKSEENIGQFHDIAFAGLKITTENGEVICNNATVFSNQYAKNFGNKTIENNSHNILSLVYMHTVGFPKTEKLKFNFSKIILYSKGLFGIKQIDINVNVNLEIPLSEKFINRKYINYYSDNIEIERAIITETGFYAIVNHEADENLHEAELIDEFGNHYYCEVIPISGELYKYIIIANLDNLESNNLELLIEKNKYLLKK